MIISENIINELKRYSTESGTEKARKIVGQGQVILTKIRFESKNNFSIRAKVNGNYSTYIDVEDGDVVEVKCNCEDFEATYGTCKHILATAFEFDDKPEYINLFNKETNTEKKAKTTNEEQYRIYRQMISSFYEEEQKEDEKKVVSIEDIKIEPKLFYNRVDKQFKLEFKIGNKQMYKIKNLADFYERMQNNDKYKYGLKLNFIHSKDAFEPESQKLLEFLMKYAEIIKYANENSSGYYSNLLSNAYIVLSNSGMDDFFDAVKGTKIDYMNEYGETKVELVDKEPNIKFEIQEKSEDEYVLKTNADIFDYLLIEGKEYIYFLQKNKLYRCSKKYQKTVLKIIDIFKVNFTKEIPFKKNEFAEFYSLVLSDMKNIFSFDKIDREELEVYMPKELKVKVFLDMNKSNFVTADIKFKYDEFEFNPFVSVDKNIPRNIVNESRVLDMFKDVGFMIDTAKNRLILTDEEKIYDFLKNSVEEFIKRFEVLATDEFRQKQIISPKMTSIGVKIENNLLSIDLSEIDIDKSELEQIMRKYSLKKKFYRLKNGQFVDLEDNKTLDTLEKISESSNISYKELAEGSITIPVYRTLYLDKILRQNEIVVKQSKEYKDLVEDVSNRQISNKFEIPKSLNADLRDYQKVGFEWLKTLDEYNLGGILADDMGLGKTIQVLSVLLSYNEKLPSLVICPSSLALNWQEEARKFAPSLKTIVISGSSEERKQKIEDIANYDLAITSYDLLKRDIDSYKQCNYTFRYLIADEAQYIKNNNTQNARAIKKINAITRYALTGTPIENSLAELWSIFDFIMPGYLFNYAKFKSQYENFIIKDNDQNTINKLKAMIEPFILRRVKEKVLTELPEKTITVLNNEMDGEQLKLYVSYVQSAKQQAKEEIESNGVQNSQIKILALLMRLRQICCHPGLFIEDYKHGSKKLNQCIEVIKDAVESRHKILLFSGYSSMFPYIEEELNKLGIKYFKLTGQTKVSERMNLVNEFNNNEDIKVFLISLKAGGTGLNLIGADMVIHYDPWWNLSAENQATDRTYRIGQRRNVQVYKLITKNSIEEKIYNMQERKAKLASDMLSTKETFISKLSEKEIMELFE